MADLCPACGSLLHAYGDLVMTGEVPAGADNPQAHAAWRERVKAP